MHFDRKAEILQEPHRRGGMARAIARRIVAWHLHKLGEKCGFAREARGHDLNDAVGFCHAKLKITSSSTRAPKSASSAVTVSLG